MILNRKYDKSFINLIKCFFKFLNILLNILKFKQYFDICFAFLNISSNILF